MKVGDVEIQTLGPDSSEVPQIVVFIHVIGDPHPGDCLCGLRIVNRYSPIQPSHPKAECQQKNSTEQQCLLLSRDGRATAGVKQQDPQASQQKNSVEVWPELVALPFR